jgi:hypothetical protein
MVQLFSAFLFKVQYTQRQFFQFAQMGDRTVPVTQWLRR